MKIIVAGKDRTADLGAPVAAESARLEAQAAVTPLWPGHSALSLKDSTDEADYLRRFTGLLRLRHGIRTGAFHIARAPGLRGRLSLAVKTGLWKLLHYQHERLAAQQSLVNELAIGALEFQQDQAAQELRELRRRVERLESADRGTPP
jgi:hypothetical protein